MYNVCILLATFNGSRFIEEQINSLFAQRDVNVSIFISDDCSSDDTLSIINSFGSSDIYILSSGNKFGSAGKNFFNLISNFPEGFDFYFFSDQDDIWFESKCFDSICHLIESGSDLFSSSVQPFSNDSYLSPLRQSTNLTNYDFLFEGAGQGCTFCLTPRLLKKSKDVLDDNFSMFSPIPLQEKFGIPILIFAWPSEYLDNDAVALQDGYLRQILLCH